MKPRVCKCCGKRIVVGLVQPPTAHLCHECALTEESGQSESQDEKTKEKSSKIIFLDRFR